jgi:hypothetical protein
VDLDRATGAWRQRLPAQAPITDVPDSVLLGARCRQAKATAEALGRQELDGEVILLLLEPSTEGRLAATLARHGEGWAATWFAAADEEDDAGAGAVSLTAGVDPFVEGDESSRPMRSAVRAGPLGPERLLLDGPVTGPHRLVVRPATIEP